MNIFNNDDQFASDMLDNSLEECVDHGYDSMINTNEQPLDHQSYFQDNLYEPTLDHQSYFQDNLYEPTLDHQSYFQDTSYEPSLDHQSYFQDTSYEPSFISESVDYTDSNIEHTFLYPQENSILTTGYPQQNSIFTNGLKGIENIADTQDGQTCGLESIENLVQLYNPELKSGNNFSADIQEKHKDYFNADGSLKTEYYDDILQSQGISSTWNEFDHQQIANALSEHRPVVVVVDANDIDPLYADSGDNAWHAITLTQVVYDSNGNILGYKGIDSNHRGQERYWSADVLETASKEWRDETQQLSVLIPAQQALAWGNFSQGEQIA